MWIAYLGITFSNGILSHDNMASIYMIVYVYVLFLHLYMFQILLYSLLCEVCMYTAIYIAVVRMGRGALNEFSGCSFPAFPS